MKKKIKKTEKKAERKQKKQNKMEIVDPELEKLNNEKVEYEVALQQLRHKMVQLVAQLKTENNIIDRENKMKKRKRNWNDMSNNLKQWWRYLRRLLTIQWTHQLKESKRWNQQSNCLIRIRLQLKEDFLTCKIKC